MGNHQIRPNRNFVTGANGKPGMASAAAVANTPQFQVHCDADKLPKMRLLEAMQASLAVDIRGTLYSTKVLENQ